MKYRAPKWLPGGHMQTIAAAKLAQVAHVGLLLKWERQRWAAPDGDFIDVDWFGLSQRTADTDGSLLVLFHGLEGGSQSHYAQAFALEAFQRGMVCAVPHFRGCSGELNLSPRAYHSGDHEEIDWILRRLLREWRQMGGQSVVAVGVSLGGNALLRWAQEQGTAAAQVVRCAAAVCAPLDLTASGEALGRGFNKWVYTRMFLQTMLPKALAKWDQHPGLFDRAKLISARTLYEFDDAFTAPLHGFRDASDYWARCSSRFRLHEIQIPTLVLNARNDPFVPASSLPTPAEAGSHVTLWQPAAGGHVGFVQGRYPGWVNALPTQVLDWLWRHR